MKVQVVTIVLQDGRRISGIFPAFWEQRPNAPEEYYEAKAIEVGPTYEDPDARRIPVPSRDP